MLPGSSAVPRYASARASAVFELLEYPDFAPASCGSFTPHADTIHRPEIVVSIGTWTLDRATDRGDSLTSFQGNGFEPTLQVTGAPLAISAERRWGAPASFTVRH